MNNRESSINSLNECVTIEDLRYLAKKRIPRMVFDFIDGGSEDEVTLRDNMDSFRNIKMIPRVLRDVGSRDQTVSIFGEKVRTPIIFSPTGLPGIIHPEAEIMAASVAGELGTIFTVSSASTHSIEAIADRTTAPLWFQLYPWKDRKVIGNLIERASKNSYQALCVTVDVPVNGGRERDFYNGMMLPPKINLRNIIDVVTKPSWCIRHLTGSPVTLANLAGIDGAPGKSVSTLAAWAQQLLYPSFCWDDLKWIREMWHGPLIVKGILSADDALLAARCGANGIVVSNHGGRQLDGAASSIDVLPGIASAVGDKLEIMMDGGVRRGIDVIKAKALGAKACMIGRPYLYGMAAGGEQGIRKALNTLSNEIDRGLALTGHQRFDQIDFSILHRKCHTFAQL
ncbi:MAG: alpha-hydroxy acid oxidase [Pseudomonadales bacterium]